MDVPTMSITEARDDMPAANRPVMQMALTAGAKKITLIALWDGKDEGDGRGGTAHMVKLAKTDGADRVRFNPIDFKKLLK